MTVARCWTILANQMDRLEAILGQEDKSESDLRGGFRESGPRVDGYQFQNLRNGLNELCSFRGDPCAGVPRLPCPARARRHPGPPSGSLAASLRSLHAIVRDEGAKRRKVTKD
jgi:hypothetical protein